jgi:large subunit ribosomal protein L3
MISGVWGKKLGMTQLFENDKVVPVTAIDLSSWLVVGNKTVDRDGYGAIRIGLLRKRYEQQSFSSEWLKKIDRYFVHVREIKVDEAASIDSFRVGSVLPVFNHLETGTVVDVVGTSRGKGFTGTVKRHNFSGGRASHGSTMGERRPGSISWMRRQGRIIKGKRMAGHMGVTRCMVQGLRVVDIKSAERVVFVKGAVPGHVGSLLFIRKK